MRDVQPQVGEPRRRLDHIGDRFSRAVGDGLRRYRGAADGDLVLDGQDLAGWRPRRATTAASPSGSSRAHRGALSSLAGIDRSLASAGTGLANSNGSAAAPAASPAISAES